MKNDSEESLFNNRVLIKQSRNGYRHSVDPVLVAHFARPQPGSRVVDLGTGCGIIPLILSDRWPGLQITGVEIQQSLGRLAKENIQINNLEDNIDILLADMKQCLDYFEPGSVDMVVSNPPYTKKNSGRISSCREKAIARHEIEITLEELIYISSTLLKDKGEFVVVYPDTRLKELLSVMEAHRINAERLRFVYPRKNDRARLILMKGVKNGEKKCITESPLVIYEGFNVYTKEMERMFV